MDVAIDFSYPGNVEDMLGSAARRGIPLVIGTTGLSGEQEAAIRAASAQIPIVRALNFSTGMALMRRLARTAAEALGEEFDIEIVETHHNRKEDAPSGSAMALISAVDPEGRFAVVHGRQGRPGRRGREIGVHAPAGRHGGRRTQRALLRPDGGNRDSPQGRQPRNLRPRRAAGCRLCNPGETGAVFHGGRIVWRVGSMDANAIIEAIRTAPKKTPVKAYIRSSRPLHFENCHVFAGTDMIVIGDYRDIEPVIEQNRDAIEDLVIENDRRNSALPLLDLKHIGARIEPGAIIRDHVEIGEGAVIMMGAVINIGAVVGEGTMIDMNAVLGGRAMVGKYSHVGAGAVLAGVVEPPSAKPGCRGRSRAHRRKCGDS